MSVSASVQGKITVTDNIVGSVALSKVLNNTYTGTLSNFGQSILVGTSTYTASIPNNLAEFVYIRNLATATGTTLTITWTPTSGVSASIISLDPGAFIIFAENTTTYGVSALSMVSNQAGTPVEFILVG